LILENPFTAEQENKTTVTCGSYNLLASINAFTPVCEEKTHLNRESFVVMIPTSSSEGLKSMDRTLARQEMAVCFEKGRVEEQRRK